MKLAGTIVEPEKALVGFKRFSGNCHYCGKKGHKSSKCFKKQQEEKTKDGSAGYGGGDSQMFTGACHHCGKKGHKKADCFQLKNNGDKKSNFDEKGAVVLMVEDVGVFDDEGVLRDCPTVPMIEELTCTLIEDHDEVLVGDTQTPILEFLAPDGLPLHEHITSKKVPQKKEYQWRDRYVGWPICDLVVAPCCQCL